MTEEQKEHESRVVTSWRSIVFHSPASFISSIVLFLSNDFWASNKTSLELLINLFYRPFSVNTNSPQRLAIFPLRTINKLGRISNLITRTVPGAAFYTRGSFYKVITRQFAARKVLFQLRVSIILDKTISTKGYVPALSTIITSEFIRDEICLTGTGEASYRRNNSSLSRIVDSSADAGLVWCNGHSHRHYRHPLWSIVYYSRWKRYSEVVKSVSG